MLVGDSGVGKTCLLVRFKDNTFLSGNFISTVGIDFRVNMLLQFILYQLSVLISELIRYYNLFYINCRH